MWMEWTIPIQKLEVNKIHVGQLQKTIKPLTPLSYADGPIVFQNLNLLLPPLPIKEYDIVSGKLILSLQEAPGVSAKLVALQDSLLNSVFLNQKTWFNDSNRTREQISGLFQPFVENMNLHLYCPLQTQEKRNEVVAQTTRSVSGRHTISIWKDGEWNKLPTTGLLQKGDSIRVALRLQGISFQMALQSAQWTGRCRVQHKISCIYSCPQTSKTTSRPIAVEEQKYSQT